MIQVSKGRQSQLMHLRTAALLCLSWSWISERTHPRIVLEEVAGLREEIREAREVVALFSTEASSCEWQAWARDLALRVSGVIDLVLLVWLLVLTCTRRSSTTPSTPSLEPLGDLDEDTIPLKAPTSETTSLVGGTAEAESASSPSASAGRARPTRPSDLRRWRT